MLRHISTFYHKYYHVHKREKFNVKKTSFFHFFNNNSRTWTCYRNLLFSFCESSNFRFCSASSYFSFHLLGFCGGRPLLLATSLLLGLLRDLRNGMLVLPLAMQEAIVLSWAILLIFLSARYHLSASYETCLKERRELERGEAFNAIRN